MSVGNMYIFALLSIFIGILSCFWGYRIFKIILGIIGFILGAYLAGSVGIYFTHHIGLVTIIAAIVGGIIGASLIASLYYVGIFILGAVGGWLLGVMITGAAGHQIHLVLLIVIAIACGILAVIFQKLIIIVSTASYGSWNIVSGLFAFFGGGFTTIRVFRYPAILLNYGGSSYYLILLFWLLLTIAGVIFQYRFAGRKKFEKS